MYKKNTKYNSLYKEDAEANQNVLTLDPKVTSYTLIRLPRKWNQSMIRLSQRPQPLSKTNRASNKKHIISNRPPNTQPTTITPDPNFDIIIRILFTPSYRGTNSLTCLNPSPEPRQSTPVTEAMDENNGQQRARPQIHERRIPAEDSRVAELEERPQQRGHSGRVWVRETELVEVVHVRNAEIQRRQEHDSARRGVC